MEVPQIINYYFFLQIIKEVYQVKRETPVGIKTQYKKGGETDKPNRMAVKPTDGGTKSQTLTHTFEPKL